MITFSEGLPSGPFTIKLEDGTSKGMLAYTSFRLARVRSPAPCHPPSSVCPSRLSHTQRFQGHARPHELLPGPGSLPS